MDDPALSRGLDYMASLPTLIFYDFVTSMVWPSIAIVLTWYSITDRTVRQVYKEKIMSRKLLPILGKKF